MLRFCTETEVWNTACNVYGGEEAHLHAVAHVLSKIVDEDQAEQPPDTHQGYNFAELAEQAPTPFFWQVRLPQLTIRQASPVYYL